MDIVPSTCLENMKRYWKRKDYQRLDDATTLTNKRKVKIARLGNKTRRVLTMRSPAGSTLKMHLEIVSPSKLFAKFHNAYVKSMTYLGGGNNDGLPKADEVVDGELLFEIYKRLVSSRELTAA